MRKKITERLGFALLAASAALVLLFLGVILFDIFSKGIGVISWTFLFRPPPFGSPAASSRGCVSPGRWR